MHYQRWMVIIGWSLPSPVRSRYLAECPKAWAPAYTETQKGTQNVSAILPKTVGVTSPLTRMSPWLISVSIGPTTIATRSPRPRTPLRIIVVTQVFIRNPNFWIIFPRGLTQIHDTMCRNGYQSICAFEIGYSIKYCPFWSCTRWVTFTFTTFVPPASWIVESRVVRSFLLSRNTWSCALWNV